MLLLPTDGRILLDKIAFHLHFFAEWCRHGAVLTFDIDLAASSTIDGRSFVRLSATREYKDVVLL